MSQFLRIHMATLLAVTLIIAWVAPGIGKETPAPNIVVVLSDDMYWHHPGFNGGPVSTPNLDGLAKQGTRLTQFYVHSVCSPTRAAFLTGRYPFRNGMEERTHGDDTAGMLTDERTLAEALKEAGYSTAIIGKWHLGNWHKHHLPMQRGFDYQYGMYGALISYYQKNRQRFYDWHRNEKILRQDGYSTDLIADEFVKVVKAHHSDRPFFMYVPFNATHGPNEAPQELIAKYRTLVQTARGKGPFAGYKGTDAVKFAMLESMDTAIGRMLDALKEIGELENTLVIFFNDNGGVRTNPPYRGGKKENYEGGVRVPCIFRWPGKIPENRKVDEIIHVTDLYPTLINIAAGSLEQKLALDGMDMWKTIAGGAESARTEVVFSLPGEFVDTGPMAIRMGKYKLVGNELFDVETDPYESINIAKSNPQIYQALYKRIIEYVGERRMPETHNKISDTIKQRPLVYGEEENANPPDWLAPYLKALPAAKQKKREAPSNKAQGTRGDSDPTAGLVSRKCKVVRTEDSIRVTGEGRLPFLGTTQVEFNGPLTLKLRARSTAGGKGRVQWRTSSQETFPKSAQVVTYDLPAGTKWQGVTVDLPIQGKASVIRLYLPAETAAVEIQSIQFLDKGGREKSWDFAKETR